jgi:hypothetical protein
MMVGLLAVGLPVGLVVVAGEAVGLPVGLPVVLAVGVAEVAGGVCASAVHPARPIMRMAPAYATWLTLSTAAPHSAVFRQASIKFVDARPS